LRQLLSAADVTLYNDGLAACFKVMGDHVYEIGLREQWRMPKPIRCRVLMLLKMEGTDDIEFLSRLLKWNGVTACYSDSEPHPNALGWGRLRAAPGLSFLAIEGSSQDAMMSVPILGSQCQPLVLPHASVCGTEARNESML